MFVDTDTKAETQTLDQLKPGEEAVIDSYAANFADELRLLEMGLTIGSAVKLVKIAPFGDPIQYRVRGYDISLRRAIAKQIIAKNKYEQYNSTT